MKGIHAKHAMVALFVSIIVMMTACTKNSTNFAKKDINILALMSKNYGLNNFLMWDVFDQYGWKITMTGVLDTIPACPWANKNWGVPPAVPAVRLAEITDIGQYDALVISPGSGNAYPIPDPFQDIINSPEALDLIARAANQGLAVFTICAGAKVLAAADVLRGKKMVGSPRFVEAYQEAGAVYVGNDRNDNPPTIDGNIITGARGQYYNLANCQAIATVIETKQNIKTRKKMPKEPFIFAKQTDFADHTIAWSKIFGGAYADGGSALCETGDGGFLITGYTFSHGSGAADLLVLKTGADGSMTWYRTFGGPGTEYGYDCITIEDGYLVCGYTTSYGAGGKDVYLIKLDLDGNESWSKTYGGASWDVGTAICRTIDGGYALCGFTHSSGSGEEDLYLVKIDHDGNESWSKTYGGNRMDLGNSVCPTADGGFFIGGSSGSFSNNTDLYLVHADARGQVVWQKTYAARGPAGHQFDWCTTMSRTRDRGAILVGYSDCVPPMDICAIKVDSDGNEVWQQVLGNNPFYDYGTAVCEIADGGYVIAGSQKSIVAGNRLYNNSLYLAKLDANGHLVLEKKVDGAGTDWCHSVCVTGDGGIVLLGYTDSDGMGGFDVFLMNLSL